MGLFRGAVVHHSEVPENSSLALMGSFPLLNGPLSLLNGLFPPECLKGRFGSRAPKAGHIKAGQSDVNFGGIWPPRGGPWVLPRTPILRFKTRVAGSWLGIARTEARNPSDRKRAQDGTCGWLGLLWLGLGRAVSDIFNFCLLGGGRFWLKIPRGGSSRRGERGGGGRPGGCVRGIWGGG